MKNRTLKNLSLLLSLTLCSQLNKGFAQNPKAPSKIKKPVTQDSSLTQTSNTSGLNTLSMSCEARQSIDISADSFEGNTTLESKENRCNSLQPLNVSLSFQLPNGGNALGSHFLAFRLMLSHNIQISLFAQNSIFSESNQSAKAIGTRVQFYINSEQRLTPFFLASILGGKNSKDGKTEKTQFATSGGFGMEFFATKELSLSGDTGLIYKFRPADKKENILLHNCLFQLQSDYKIIFKFYITNVNQKRQNVL